MRIPATVYKVNKGRGNTTYLATSRREHLERFAGKAILLETTAGEQFPTKVRKLVSGANRSSYCFNVPDRLARKYVNKQKVMFQYVTESTKELLGLPDKTIRGFPLYAFDLGDEALCWIYTKGCKPYTLPKGIPKEKDGYSLFELYGAFFCEGFKARKEGKHRDRFSFANAEATEIKWFMEACKVLLGIGKCEWQAQVLFPQDDEETVKRLKSQWSKTGLTPEKISVCKNQTVRSEDGICILLIYNSTLAEVFYHITEQAKEKLLSEKKYCWEFFRGLSRGDLGVTMNPNGVVKLITFTTDNEENMQLFQRVCEKTSLTTNKPYFVPGKRGHWETQIMGYKNFVKVLENSGITHAKRKQRLASGFLKASKSSIYKYLKAVGNGAATSPEARDELGISIVTATAMFAKYRREGYLAKAGAGGNNAIIHGLTQKGQETLDFYENVYKGLDLE